MKKNAAIFGAGGHARVVASILKANKLPILGFFDDSFEEGERIQGKPVLGRFKDILNFKKDISDVYLAIGDNSKRRDFYAFLEENKFNLPHLVHPSVYLEDDVEIKDGAVICIGAVIATEVQVGRGVIINTASCVDHESVLGDFVHIAPRVAIAGRVKVGLNSFVGINSSIIDKVVIGSNVIVGAGAVVLKDVPDNTTVVGVWK